MNTNAVVVRTRRFLKDTRGANLVEYIILVGVVSVLCLVAFTQFGSAVKTKVTNQTSAIDTGVKDGTN